MDAVIDSVHLGLQFVIHLPYTGNRRVNIMVSYCKSQSNRHEIYCGEMGHGLNFILRKTA